MAMFNSYVKLPEGKPTKGLNQDETPTISAFLYHGQWAPVQFEGDKPILVGGFNPSEKYEFVSWDYYSQYMEN
jgi:hypothetical protein